MIGEPARRPPNYDDPSWGRAEARMLYAERPAAGGSANVLLVRVEADEARGPRAAPAVVSIALDTSGSMEGEPLEAARRGCLRLASALASADEASLIDCGSRPRTVFPSRPVADRARLRSALARLRAGGGADLATALKLALEQVSYRREGASLRTIVVVSDGPPTGRLRTPEAFAPLLDEAVRANASIVAVGVGAEYDVSLLGEMARRTGGRLIGVGSPAELEESLAAIGADLANTRVGPPSVTIRLLGGNDAARCEEAVTARILSPLRAGEAREATLDVSHAARRPGTYVVAEVLVEALDAASGRLSAVTLTALTRFQDGAAERPDELVAEARRALDQARAIASAGGAIRDRRRSEEGVSELARAAAALERLGRGEAAAAVRRVLEGVASGRTADPNKALAPVVLDIAIGRSAPPGAEAVQRNGTDALGEAENAAT